jgi:hypothetical protein
VVGAVGAGEQRGARHDQRDDRDRRYHGGDYRGLVAADERQTGDCGRGSAQQRDDVA